ncbi:DHHA1 domain-containing protein [Bacillus mexicanus]|uniref:single-stranded-DNA-specific exonuclease RecJ n=1 Tax=Bacillus mexicanus TaxID=2834415 RepID=UPI003D25CC26
MLKIETMQNFYPYDTEEDIKNKKVILDHIGVNEQGINNFLNPSLKIFNHPFDMKDLEKALDRLISAFEKKEKILFYGDYDADGVTTTALFIKSLRDKGIKVDYYVPHRHKDGYGLNANRMEEFAQKYDLIVTGDTGIKEMETVHNCPIDVIITDHHEPFVTSDKNLLKQYKEKSTFIEKNGETMVIPSAYAVVNPKRIDCNYPNKCLSGVAVIFKLLQGLFIKKSWDQMDIIKHLDMVAVGLVADLVPQFDIENQDSEVRLMTLAGIQMMNQDPKPWVQTIIELANIKKVDFSSLGFVFGPRFNAAGRLDSAFPVVEFLLEDNFDLSFEKGQLLEKFNKERKELQKLATENIQEFLSNRDSSWYDRIVVVKADPEYHSGIAGLVASQLVSTYNVPSIVLCEKTIDGEVYLTGSCRSIEGIDILHLLIETEKTLGNYKYGGHEMAAGLTIKLDQFELFREAIRKAAFKLDDSKFAKDNLFYEIELPINELSLSIVQFIENTNSKIRLFSPNNYIYSPPTQLGKSIINASVYIEKERSRYRASLWKRGEEFRELYAKDLFEYIDIVYTTGMFNDNISISIDNYSIPNKKYTKD